MVSLKGVLGASIVVLVGLGLLPTVHNLTVGLNHTTEINGTTASIADLIPVFYAITVLGGAAAIAVFV